MKHRVLPLCVAWILASACVSTSPPPSGLPDAGVDDLETRSLLLLFAERRAFEPFVAQQALLGSPSLRTALARFLGRTGLPEARGVLESLRVDDDPAVRRAAVFGLGLLGQGEARAALLTSAAAPDREEAVLAVEALAKLGTPLSEVLLALLPLAEEERWPRLLPSLHRFESPSLAVLASRGLEAALDPSVAREARRGAAFALTRVASAEHAPVLVGLLRDADPMPRAWAAEGLGEVGSDAGPLLGLLADADARVRAAALAALGRQAERGSESIPEGERPRWLPLATDRSPSVRLAALAGAGAWLPDAEVLEALRLRLAGGSGAERALALAALIEAEPALATARLGDAAHSPEVALRVAAASLGPLPVAETLRADPNPRVRAAACLRPLPAPRARAEAPAGLLAECLTDLDGGVRAAVLEWLVASPVLPFEPIEASLALARKDDIPDGRLAAVRALVARALAEPLDRGAVVRRLERLAADPDALVRREAVSGLVRLDRPPPPPGPALLGRGGDVYRQIVQQTARPSRMELRTTAGTMTLELECAPTPLTCLNFIQLAARGFYDGAAVTRLVPGRWLETGDPRGDGRGGPGYTVRDEVDRLRFDEGVVAMAAETPDGAGSRLLLALAPLPALDGRLTTFGRIVAGLEVLRALAPGDQILSVREVVPR